MWGAESKHPWPPREEKSQGVGNRRTLCGTKAAEEGARSHTAGSGRETRLKLPPADTRQFFSDSFCALVPPTKKTDGTPARVFTRRPCGSRGGDCAPPRRLGPPWAAARPASPCSHGPAPQAPATRLPADTPPPHARPPRRCSASTAPGRPEAAAAPPDAAAAKRAGRGQAAPNGRTGAYKPPSYWLRGRGAGPGAGRLPSAAERRRGSRGGRAPVRGAVRGVPGSAAPSGSSAAARGRCRWPQCARGAARPEVWSARSLRTPALSLPLPEARPHD